jgi:hypothetical protein
VPRLDPMGRRLAARRGRQLRLGDVDLVMQAEQELGDLRMIRAEEGLRETEVAPQFVERSVGADARVVLRYAATTGESRLSPVAGAGVEPRTILASGRPGNMSSGELNPWTGQNEMCSTSLCLAS